MREIVFDTETTGLDPKTGDRMVEIGCIELINRMPTGEIYHCFYNPQRFMPPEAEAVHGYSDAFLADKPLFADKADALLAFLGESPLIAHNAGFDLGFLNAELAIAGRDPLPRERIIDTVAMARRIHPGAKLSLDALCVRYGIDRSHRVKHGALLDAELLAQLYLELHGGRQIGLTLVADAARSAGRPENADPSDAAPARPIRPARPHAASAEELEAHASFVATLNNPLWATPSRRERR